MSFSQYRIAYIHGQALPARTAISQQVLSTISWISKNGMDVELIIPRKWRSLGVSYRVRKNFLLDFYDLNDTFKITELLNFPLAWINLENISHWILGPIYASFRRYDIIYTRNPILALIVLALGKKLIYETFRIYDPNIGKLGILLQRNGYNANLLGIITHSPLSREGFIRIGIPKEKISVIPNGFNPSHFIPCLRKKEARKILGWDEEERIVCYAGCLDSDKGIKTVLKLAEKTQEFKYFLIGYFRRDHNDWILKDVSQKRLKNVQLHSWVNGFKLSKFLFASDVLVIPPTAVPLSTGRTVLPMKTFTYLAAGRPILAPKLPDTQSILNSLNAVLVEPDNLDLSAEAISRIFSDPHLAKKVSEQARLDSFDYTWQRRAERIIAFLNQIIE